MDILGIGFPELILIFLIALMVLGPRRLPEVAAKAGKIVRDLRSMSQGFLTEWRREIMVAARLDELEETRRELEEAKRLLQETRSDIASETTQAANDASQAIDQTKQAATSVANHNPTVVEAASKKTPATPETPPTAPDSSTEDKSDSAQERTIRPPQPPSETEPATVTTQKVTNE